MGEICICNVLHMKLRQSINKFEGGRMPERGKEDKMREGAGLGCEQI